MTKTKTVKDFNTWSIKHCKEVIEKRKKSIEEEENKYVKEIIKESLKFWTDKLERVQNEKGGWTNE